MRKRNHTVTIRMNKAEYDLLQSKVKESGKTQQEVVIKAIADLKIVSAEEVEELKRLNQMFADILCQLRGATTNINQIARKLVQRVLRRLCVRPAKPARAKKNAAKIARHNAQHVH